MSSNSTGAGGFNETEEDTLPIAAGFSLFISILGMIGNSLVFCYLSFRIKRTKYTVYIINLAIADLIYLIFFSIDTCISFFIDSEIADQHTICLGLTIIRNIGMFANMFLLTAISVERCFAVFYPVWYRCKRPKAQSVIVCAFLWGLSILLTLTFNLGCHSTVLNTVAPKCTAVRIFRTVLVFLVTIPIMVVSSLILLIRIRNTSKQCQPPKLFIVIVTSVIIFLISVAPLTLMGFLYYLKVLPTSFPSGAFFFACFMCICIQSSINPFIYFLVGRQQMQGAHEYLIRALKRVFREGEEEGENGNGETSNRDMGNTNDSNISKAQPCF